METLDLERLQVTPLTCRSVALPVTCVLSVVLQSGPFTSQGPMNPMAFRSPEVYGNAGPQPNWYSPGAQGPQQQPYMPPQQLPPGRAFVLLLLS